MAHLGFPYSPQKESNANIDIKIAAYQVELNTLFLLIPNHFALLHKASSLTSVAESRTRIVKQYASVEFAELAAFATKVFEHKKATLRGQPTAEDFTEELALWETEHKMLSRGY